MSLGGWLATDYAIRRTGRVQRLALRAPGGIGRQRYGAVFAALASCHSETAVRVLPFGSCLDRATSPIPSSTTCLRSTATTVPRHDTLPVFSDTDLKSITAPLFVALGARDRMISSRDTAARLTRLQPTASIKVLADVGHGTVDDGDELHTFLSQGAKP